MCIADSTQMRKLIYENLPPPMCIYAVWDEATCMPNSHPSAPNPSAPDPAPHAKPEGGPGPSNLIQVVQCTQANH